jgi:hypothetical protein
MRATPCLLAHDPSKRSRANLGLGQFRGRLWARDGTSFCGKPRAEVNPNRFRQGGSNAQLAISGLVITDLRVGSGCGRGKRHGHWDLQRPLLQLLIVPGPSGYSAFVQIAEGGAPYTAIVPIHIAGDKVSFALPPGDEYGGIKFEGTWNKTALTIKWPAGTQEVLKRGRSYWQ